MRPRLLDYLVCPLDGLPLEMDAWESRPLPLTPADRRRAEELGIPSESLESEIQFGVLLNPRQKILYPIYECVPRMLTFSAAVSRSFEERFASRLRQSHPDFSLPDEAAMPGERDVLSSFSTEWVNYDWDGESYWDLDPEQMFRVMRFLLDLDERPPQGGRFLEIGIGVGGIADNIARTQGCELVGLDLSHAVEPAYKHFGSRNPFLHVVQASAFRPPLAAESFDFVYSQGVLHHTFSTRAAVESVARLPRKGGRFYFWVYSPDEVRRSALRRVLYSVENAIRPICARLPPSLQTAIVSPAVPVYMVHQKFLRKRAVSYGWREALHAARDRFTPRFAHRHTEEEAGEWLRSFGYEDITFASQRNPPEYVPQNYVANTGVDGVRK